MGRAYLGKDNRHNGEAIERSITRSGNIRQGGRKGHTGDGECVSAFVPVERKIYP